ncbi:hypothetical protein DRO03_02955 [Methanosarcinales archaeon]|nr:MAG: hypothetical protein DRO03_02955 [Methanosarcinales archaeon]
MNEIVQQCISSTGGMEASGWTHTNWSDPEFWDECGGSFNLVVNAVADVLHTPYIEAHRERSGGINGDGPVTTADAVIVLQMIASGEQSDAADVNRNGAVTSVDAADNHAGSGRKHRDQLVLSIMVMLTIPAMRRYDPCGRLTISVLTHHRNLPKHRVR